MKKTLIAIALVGMIAGFTSCNKTKEGQFNPKQKISQVYQEESDNEDGTWQSWGRQLAEQWNWDGKKLASIQYSVWGCNETFSYDNKDRIISGTIVDASGATLTSEYAYDGKELTSITSKKGGEITSKIEFTHENGKISQFSISEMEYYWDEEDFRTSPLRCLFPERICRDIRRCQIKAEKLAKSAGKAMSTTKFNVTWDGKNISSLSTSLWGMVIKINYTYDNKINPYNHLMSTIGFSTCMEMGTFSMFNENNPTQIHEQITGWGENEDMTIHYTYEYDGNYPIKATYEAPVISENWEYDPETGEKNVFTTEYTERTVTEYIYSK